MNRIPACLRYLLCSVALLLVCNVSFASHIVGVDLFYTWVSGNTYKITLIAYGNCGSSTISALPTATPQICIYDGNTYNSSINLSVEAPSAGVEITPVCPGDVALTQCTNTSYTIPGIKKFIYSATVTLPHTSTVWRFLFTGTMVSCFAGRAAAITNISAGSVIQVVDTLNNSSSHNSSPILTVVPTPFFCLDNSDNYNPGAVDPDGDDLSFFLVPGMDGGTVTTCNPGGAVTYSFPYTATAPLAASSFTFDPATGQISFYPNALQRSLVVYNIEEHRSGAFVGTSQREMTFLVLTCTNVAASGGLAGGTSGVIVQDSTHVEICAGSGPFSVNFNPTEPAGTNNITVTYTGLPSGATFTITGNGTPTPHAVFAWTSTGVTPGSYTFYVTLTDNNCPLSGVQTIAYTVNILPLPTLNTTILSTANCLRKEAVLFTPGGGGSPWTIDVSAAPGDTIQTFTSHGASITDSLSPGTYTFTIFAIGGCKSSQTLTVAAPPVISLTATYTNPSYCGYNDGSIKLHHLPAGTTDTIKYNFNGVAQPPLVFVVASDSTVLLSGLSGGVYSNITATVGFCVSAPTGPITLVTPPFTMRAITYTNPSWCGNCDGVIKLYGLHPGQTDTIYYTLGGVAQPPIVHTIGSDSMVTLTGMCAGTYTNFTAKTAGICVSNTLGPITLTTPPFTIRAITFTNPLWCGICTGTITLYGLHPGQTDTIYYTIGGVSQPPLSFLIPADSQVTLTGLCAGTYANFTARNSGTCVSNTVGPVTLTVPPFTIRAISSTNPSWCGVCDGTIRLYGLHPGGTDTIYYTRGGIAQPPFVQVVGADSIITLTGMCSGVYDNFTARAGSSCVSNTLGPVTLTVPPFTIRTLTSVNPDYCGICNGSVTLYGLHPGETDSIHYTIGGVAQTPFVQAVGADSILTLTGLCAGAYNNFVAHTGGVCVSNSLGPVDLTVPPFTMRAITSTNPDYCGICNGTITLLGIHPGELDTITYTLGGVAQPPIIQTIPADSMIVMTGLCAGTYADFVAHTGGVCVSNALGPVNLTVPPFAIRSLSSTNPDYCGICNGTITIYGVHPGETDTISYTLGGVAQPVVVRTIGSDSLVVLSGLCAGLYDNFVVRTGGVCVSNTLGPVNLTVPPFVVRSSTFTNPTKCGFCNGSITIHGAHPGQMDTVNYNFNGAPQPGIPYTVGTDSLILLPALCEGVYSNIVVHTAGICVSNTVGPDTLKAPPIIPAFSFVVHEGCGGDTLIVSNTSWPAADLTYTWYFGDGGTDTATNPIHIYHTPGTFNIRLIITNTRCVDSISHPVTLNNLIVAGFTANPDSFLCQGKPVIFTNTSLGTQLAYTWIFGDGYSNHDTNTVHIFKYTGTYDVQLVVTNYVPCFDTASISLTVDSMSTISMKATDSVFCGGHDVTFTGIYSEYGNTGITWTFSDGLVVQNANPVVHGFESAGVYTVSIEAFYRACPDTSASRTVLVVGYPNVNIGPDTAICPGSQPIVLTDYNNEGNPAAHWMWGTGETGARMVVSAPGVYSVSVTIDGCTSTGSVTVKNDCYMDIPNVFTPNGDGTNDYFFPRTLLTSGLTSFHMSIFNRWGQLIFETDNTGGRGWDGRLNDVAQPEGVYVYMIDGTFHDGQKEHHHGNVTLLR